MLTFRLGRFFRVKIVSCNGIKSGSLSAVGELQLLWLDRNHEGQKLASVRLYILPEDCPTGRLSEHGQVCVNIMCLVVAVSSVAIFYLPGTDTYWGVLFVRFRYSNFIVVTFRSGLFRNFRQFSKSAKVRC